MPETFPNPIRAEFFRVFPLSSPKNFAKSDLFVAFQGYVCIEHVGLFLVAQKW